MCLEKIFLRRKGHHANSVSYRKVKYDPDRILKECCVRGGISKESRQTEVWSNDDSDRRDHRPQSMEMGKGVLSSLKV